jgi:nucleotide-binding universal stress UspA family protein
VEVDPEVPVVSERPDRKPVVVGVDGSPCSVDALQWAVRFAGLTGHDVQAVLVWEPPERFGWSLGLPALTWDAHAWAEKQLAETVATAFPVRPAGLHLVVQEGDPATVLLERSAGAMLLVVGSRGLGRIEGFVFGSVSAKCAAHAACPVLVVRETPAVSHTTHPPNPSPMKIPDEGSQP